MSLRGAWLGAGAVEVPLSPVEVPLVEVPLSPGAARDLQPGGSALDFFSNVPYPE
jgi:hypothetical protein